jgi:DNA polymerase-1
MSALDDVELTFVRSMDDVLALFRWLGENRPVHALGLDTETTGLNPFRDKVRLIQVGDHRHGWALDRDMWLGVLADLVRRWDGDWILHNSIFDTLSIAESCGIEVPRHRIHDTMIQSRINESNMSAALKSQAARHVDPAAAGLQEVLKGTNFTWETVPTEYGPYWQYGALDPVLTYHLDMYHRPQVEIETPKAYELEMSVLWVVEKMRRNGAFIDRRWVLDHYEKFTAYIAQVEQWVIEHYGVKPGSNAAIIQILENEGYRFSKATKSGAKSLDAEVLGGIDHPLAQAVLGRRQAQKMASTYLKFYLTETTDEHPFVHPSFNTLGARTGRMSCDSPNLQNVPRLGTSRFADAVRNCIASRYIPHELLVKFDTEGFTQRDAVTYGTLIFCDFSQIEMRILSDFAGDEAMIAAFHGEEDFFVALARQIYQDETINKKDPRRRVTKNAGYATIYGAGVRKFAQTAGVAESEARAFFNRWNTLYPGVKHWQQSIIDQATVSMVEYGQSFVRSPLTNRRYVGDSGKEYALGNYQIQGTAAEINKMKLVELANAGLDDIMFATIHDEVLLDVPGSRVIEVVNTLKKVMNDDTLLRVPIQAEVSFGHRWGMKQDWKDND